MRKNSVKNTRVNGEVHRVLAEVIRSEIKDPRINPMTSVVTVEVAPDLKTCKAWISVLGDEDSQKETLEGLKSAEGYIRSLLAKKSISGIHRKFGLFLTSLSPMACPCQKRLMKLIAQTEMNKKVTVQHRIWRWLRHHAASAWCGCEK